MLNLRAGIVLLISLFAFSGCGKTVVQLAHTLPTKTNSKPLPEGCKNANSEVWKILFGGKGFVLTLPTFLADGSCAISVQIDSHENALPLLKKFRDQTKLYTYILMTAPPPISIWVDEPAIHYPPVLDKDGRIIDSSPTDDECRAASQQMAKTYSAGTFSFVANPGAAVSRLRCYVDGVFADDASFESFMSTKKDGELFHVHYARTNGVVTTIWIRPLRSI